MAEENQDISAKIAAHRERVKQAAIILNAAYNNNAEVIQVSGSEIRLSGDHHQMLSYLELLIDEVITTLRTMADAGPPEDVRLEVERLFNKYDELLKNI